MNPSTLYDWAFNTKCIQDGNHKKPSNSHAMPIFQTSSFTFDSPDEGRKLFAGEMSGNIYSRLNNPTVEALEKSLAVLEVENGGESHGICFSTGMAAVSGVVLSLLQCGDHIVVGNVLYGCTLGFITEIVSKFGIEFSAVDTSNMEAVKAAVRSNTKLIYYETPANPTGAIADIAGISQIAHSSQAGIMTCVDSTFASPFNQQPLMLGADIVVHSLTKYLSGHGDVVAGAVVVRNKNVADKIRDFRRLTGGCLGPFDSWLVSRGLKTLAVRMNKHNSNAIVVANFLKDHPLIENVLFAYFPDFPNHDVAVRQMSRVVHKKVLRRCFTSFTNDSADNDSSDDDSVDANDNMSTYSRSSNSSANSNSSSDCGSPKYDANSLSPKVTPTVVPPSPWFSSSSPLFSSSSLFDVEETREGGFGGTFSFTMKGGYESAKCLLENLHLATLCVSLGNTDTLIEHPGSMTHSGFSDEQMKAAGFSKSLVRISVGLEEAADIVEDLHRGLEVVARMEQEQKQEKADVKGDVSVEVVKCGEEDERKGKEKEKVLVDGE